MKKAENVNVYQILTYADCKFVDKHGGCKKLGTGKASDPACRDYFKRRKVKNSSC